MKQKPINERMKILQLRTQFQIACAELSDRNHEAAISRLHSIVNEPSYNDSSVKIIQLMARITLISALNSTEQYEDALLEITNSENFITTIHSVEEIWSLEEINALLQVRKSTALVNLKQFTEAYKAAKECLTLNKPKCNRYANINLAIASSFIGKKNEVNLAIDNAIKEACNDADLEILRVAAWNKAILPEAKLPDAWAYIAFVCSEKLRYPINGFLNHTDRIGIKPSRLAVTQSKDKLCLESLKCIDEVKLAPDYYSLSCFDIDLYAYMSALVINSNVHLHVRIADSNIQPTGLYEYLTGRLKSIKFDNDFSNIIKHSFLLRSMGLSELDIIGVERIFDEVIRRGQDVFNQPTGPPIELPTLFWTSSSPWPWAFSLTLQVISTFYMGAMAYLQEYRRHFDSHVDYWYIQGHTTKLLPIYDHASDAGAMDLGLIWAPQSLTYGSIALKVTNKRNNLNGLREIGYSSNEAEVLNSSGIVGLPTSDLSRLPTKYDIFGNFPDEHMLNGFNIDTFYGAKLIAQSFNDSNAVYGFGNYKDLINKILCKAKVNVESTLRVKVWKIPIVSVNDRSELNQLIEDIRIIIANDEVIKPNELYFRGQTNLHHTTRHPQAMEMLYGSNKVIEPSLFSSSIRNQIEYSRIHSKMQLCLQDSLYETLPSSPLGEEYIHLAWKNIHAADPLVWHKGVMAMCQHYGIPTDGIDVTHSIDVALWFALNSFKKYDGISFYQPIGISKEVKHTPVIYVFCPGGEELGHSFFSVNDIDIQGLDFLRPARQESYFFCGADILRQNRLAEALLLAIRIGENFDRPNLSQQHLFPNPGEDVVYSVLLAMRNRFSETELKPFLESISIYKCD